MRKATKTRRVPGDPKNGPIVEAPKKPSVIELLDSWGPLSDEDAMPEIEDYPPEPFEL